MSIFRVGTGKRPCESHRRSREYAGRQAWVQILALQVLSYIPPGKYSLSKVQFPHLQDGRRNGLYLPGWWWDSKNPPDMTHSMGSAH